MWSVGGGREERGGGGNLNTRKKTDTFESALALAPFVGRITLGVHLGTLQNQNVLPELKRVRVLPSQ